MAALVQRGLLDAGGSRGGAPAVVGVADADEDAAGRRAVHGVLEERSRRMAGIRTLRRPCRDLGATSPSQSSQPRSTLITPEARSMSSRRRGELAAAQAGVEGGRPERPVLRAVEPVEHRLDLRGGREPGLAPIDGGLSVPRARVDRAGPIGL